MRFIILTYWGQDPEKLHALEEHLRENGILSWAYYFGYPGKGLKVREVPGVEYIDPPYEMTSRNVGQNLTHWGLWSALKFNCELNPTADWWMIIEDDFRFNEGWQDIYNEARSDLPEDWDMVFFGNCCLPEEKQFVGKHLIRGAGLCLHWYMLNKKAINILLETNKIVKARIDAQMTVESYPHLHTYSVIPSIGSQFETILQP
jgi:hypothetical protein